MIKLFIFYILILSLLSYKTTESLSIISIIEDAQNLNIEYGYDSCIYNYKIVLRDLNSITINYPNTYSFLGQQENDYTYVFSFIVGLETTGTTKIIATSPIDGQLTFDLDQYTCTTTPKFDVTPLPSLVKYVDQHRAYLKIITSLKLLLNSNFSVSCTSNDFTLQSATQVNTQLIKLAFTPKIPFTLVDNIKCSLTPSLDQTIDFEVVIGYQKGAFKGSYSTTIGKRLNNIYYSSYLTYSDNTNPNPILSKSNDDIYWKPFVREGNRINGIVYSYNNTKGYLKSMGNIKSDFIIIDNPLTSTDIPIFNFDNLIYPNIISDNSQFIASPANNKVVYLNLNYKTDYKYADFINNVEFTKGSYSFKKYLLYPFGFESGTLEQYTISYDFPHYKTISSMNARVFGNPSKLYSFTPPPSVFSKPVTFVSLIKQLNSSAFIYRVDVKDITSGLNRIVSPDGTLLASSPQLVSGNENNGAYEFIYTGTSKTIVILNNIGLYEVKELPNFVTPFRYSPPARSFVGIQFDKNNLDLSNLSEPLKNRATIIFNLPTNMISNIQVSLSFYSFGSYYEKSTTFHATSPIVGTYIVDFEILPRRWSGFLEYTIKAGDLELNSDTLCAIDQNNGLKVTSDHADYVPPLVTELSHYPSSSVNVAPPEDENLFVDLAFNITIKDQYNGLKNGTIWIASDLDPIGFNFTIYPNISLNNDAYLGTYTLPFKVSKKCKSQEYYIKDMKLFDRADSISSIYFPYMNPFFDQDINTKLSIVCEYKKDEDPPYLSSFKIFNDTSLFDVSKANNLIYIEFTMKDDGSGLDERRTPMVYASENSFANLYNTSELINASTGLYRCYFYIPYGFGLFGDIHFSIYGLLDNQMNFRGYTTSDLESSGFDYHVHTTTTFSPLITNSQGVLNNGLYYITLHGFGLGETSAIQFTKSNENNPSFATLSNAVNTFKSNSYISFMINPYELPFSLRIKKNTLFSNVIHFGQVVDPTFPPITTGGSTTTTGASTTSPSTPTTGTGGGIYPGQKDFSDDKTPVASDSPSSSSKGLTPDMAAGITVGIVGFVALVGVAIYIKQKIFKKAPSGSIEMK